MPFTSIPMSQYGISLPIISRGSNRKTIKHNPTNKSRNVTKDIKRMSKLQSRLRIIAQIWREDSEFRYFTAIAILFVVVSFFLIKKPRGDFVALTNYL